MKPRIFCCLCSGVDRFKRQFAYLEENQGKPGAGAGAGGGRSTALHRHHA